MKKISINYFFFGIPLITLISLIIWNTTTIEYPIKGISLFLIVQTLGQVVLEIGLAIWLLHKKYFSNICKGCIFLLLVSHIIEAILLKVMDISFLEGLNIVRHETWSNFIEMLSYTNIPLAIWVIFALLSFSIPLWAILLYNVTNKITFSVKSNYFFTFLFCLILALFLFDLKMTFSSDLKMCASFQKILPWKRTFILHKMKTIKIKNHLQKPIDEKQFLKILSQIEPLEKRPNIYIFVIESLRDDAITKTLTPKLFQFRKENIEFDLTLANSNATNISCFSLFYSQYPFFWIDFSFQKWKFGSVPLNLLKKAGYKINVYSSSQLKYYHIDEMVFGENFHLADKVKLFSHFNSFKAWQDDKKAIDALLSDVKESKSSNIFVTFLDSSHFVYSMPENFPLKVTPQATDRPFFLSQKNVQLLKNRYLNSVSYVDQLLGSFFDELKKEKLFDDSIIVITGDHGEEFMEHGHIFHCSHLNHEQTNSSIYCKFGDNKKKIQSRICSHMNIFPTIFSYLFDRKFDDLLVGSSLFDTSDEFILSARYNASQRPYEFFLCNGKEKLILRFKHADVFNAKKLEIVSLRSIRDQEILNNRSEKIKSFEPLLNRLFH